MSGGYTEDFVGYGTAVEQVSNDESLTKLASENKLKAQKVRDKQGRERFHGAFTGGYSAGYYNTVGTEEGWAPSTFTSSRRKQRKDDVPDKQGRSSRKPEDYMDEEDLEAFGIAPRQIQTTDTFKKDNSEGGRAAWDPVVPGMAKAITDVIKPVHFSAAVKLLRLMGWKHGQGIGPRIKRKRTKDKTGQRIMGPSLPSQHDEGESEDSEVDEYVSNLTFAPKDMNPVNFSAKDDLHGIGYQPLAVQSQPKSSSVEEQRLTFGGHRKGISGQAFGVGIEEEDEDADIYGKERISDYDTTLGDEPNDLHTFTKPSGKPSSHIYQSSKVLEGFCLAQKKDKANEKYTIPDLPRGYRPRAAVTGTSQLPKLYGKLDKTLRGLIIGEAIQDVGLVSKPEGDKQTEFILPGKKEEINLNEVKPVENQDYVQEEAPLPPMRSAEPLNKQSVDFKPFTKYPEKQARYERYLMLKRSGDRDAYNKVAPPDFRIRDKEREREEFERSGKFFKDLSGVMASRFTRSKQTDEDDDSKVSVRVDEEMDGLLDDKKQAVEMKLFGKLTRESYEWHPHRLLCKRFNIPDPYPNSQLVGLPTVYKDKISAYNFLDLETLTTAPSELKEKREEEALAEKSKESKGAIETSSDPKSLPVGEKAPIDLFKAVFQDSDSDTSDSSSDEEPEPQETPEESETDNKPKDDSNQSTNLDIKSKLEKLQEQYSQSRDVASVYMQQAPPSTDESTDAQNRKVTFVPKKDRYQSEKKVKKSRWSNVEDSTEIDEEKTAENSVVKLESGEQMSINNGGDSVERLSCEPPAEDTNRLPDSAVLPQSPASPGTPESAEDSWMPALPPSLAGSTSDTVVLADLPVTNAKKHKHKDKRKHRKESKKKKSHKEQKKKR